MSIYGKEINLVGKFYSEVINDMQNTYFFLNHSNTNELNNYIEKNQGLSEVLVSSYIESISLGCFFALFIIYVVLLILLKSQKANIYSALFCVTWFLRTGVTGNEVFNIFFPRMPWIVKFYIEYMSIPFTVIILLELFCILFPSILYTKIQYIIKLASVLFAISILVFNDLIIDKMLGVYLLLCVALLVYIVIKLIFNLHILKLKLEQYIFTVGIVCFLYAALHDFMLNNNIAVVTNKELIYGSVLILVFCNLISMVIFTFREVEEASLNKQRLINENAALDRVNNLRGAMMSTITHEMRTPLTVMSLYAQLVLEKLQGQGIDEQTEADLSTISYESKRLADMTTGILNLTKEQEEATTHTLVNLEKIIIQISHLYKPIIEKSKNILNIRIEKDLPEFYGNITELTQVLWNMLDNASKNTKEGIICIDAMVENNNILVSVKDTGKGVFEEFLSSVLLEDDRKRDESTSKGLSICRRIIENYKGEIFIESILGKGEKIYFKLPLDKEVG